MTWEQFVRPDAEIEYDEHRTKTDIECPVCGRKIYMRTDVVLTTYPPKYRYECICGWTGSAKCWS